MLNKRFRNFQIAAVRLTQYPGISRIYDVPAGVIYINRAAEPGCNVYKVIFPTPQNRA